MSQESLYIYGKHPVEELLASDPKRISKFFVKEGIDAQFFNIVKAASTKHRIPIAHVDQRKLDELAEQGIHQGIVALVTDVPYLELKEWLKTIDVTTNPCCVLLDEIEDPHNVGAIVRSAAAFGASGIILGKHRQAQVTGTVVKASAGTIDKIALIRTTNTNDAIEKLKEKKFWIVGLAGEGTTTLIDLDMHMPICFVIGSEEHGIREKTREHCDFLVSIPMHNNVESLNASVSAAVALYEWQRQAKK